MSLNCFTFLHLFNGLTVCWVSAITEGKCYSIWIHDWINVIFLPSQYLQSAVKCAWGESRTWWNVLIHSEIEDVWQIVPICSMTLTNVAPGSSLCLSWASCFITLAAGENHEKSKEWAQTGTGSRSESCNHVWWLIVGSGECHCERSHCVGHIWLRYSHHTARFAAGVAELLPLEASASTFSTFRCWKWTLW